ncbi:MAG: DNA polymerase III subunit gamma/tau, partial [Rhodomicrobium sp.]
ATTEIRKVPVTILSRCQRFDLRRVDASVLEAHLAGILEKEGQTANDGALALIARAAEGSVRDGLSLLDQALTLGQGSLTPAGVLEMLGLSGRGAIFDLLEQIFEGNAEAALSSLNALHDTGGDPLMILTDAADAVHALSRLKAVPGVYPPDFSSADKARADKLSGAIPVPRLAIAWQMLLKGFDEASRAPRPFAAAEMIVIRMCYTAQLPSPADIVGDLAGKSPARAERREGAHWSARPSAVQTPDQAETEATAEKPDLPQFGAFEDIVSYADQIRDIKLKIALEEQVELVKFGPGYIELHTLEGAPQNLAQDLSRKMQSWTGERWIVSLSEARGLEPLGARRRAGNAQAVEDIRKHPVVKSVMHHFPGAEIKGVRTLD